MTESTAQHRPAALRHGLGRPDLRGVYGDRGSGACERAVDVHPRYSLNGSALGARFAAQRTFTQERREQQCALVESGDTRRSITATR